jgi:hypothetical protein
MLCIPFLHHPWHDEAHSSLLRYLSLFLHSRGIEYMHAHPGGARLSSIRTSRRGTQDTTIESRELTSHLVQWSAKDLTMVAVACRPSAFIHNDQNAPRVAMSFPLLPCLSVPACVPLTPYEQEITARVHTVLKCIQCLSAFTLPYNLPRSSYHSSKSTSPSDRSF